MPGGKLCRSRSSPPPGPFEPVPLSQMVTEPTLWPWASFISTTVLATLDSDQKMIVDETAAMKNRLCFMATNYIQSCGLMRHFVTHMRRENRPGQHLFVNDCRLGN